MLALVSMGLGAAVSGCNGEVKLSTSDVKAPEPASMQPSSATASAAGAPAADSSTPPSTAAAPTADPAAAADSSTRGNGPTGFEGNTKPLTEAQALQAFKTQGHYHHISQIDATATPGVKRASLMHDHTAVWITFDANTGKIMSETPQ